MSESNLTWRLLEVIVRANETIYATTTLKNTGFKIRLVRVLNTLVKPFRGSNNTHI